ncbi:MAG: hypothetical protein ACYSX0_21315 [Planctomycetota bacterium]|jgi:hypothetical protein
MTLEQRVEKLERQNRWFKRGAALVVALAACGTLVAQKKEEWPRDLVVRSLTVEDALAPGSIRMGRRGLVMTLDFGQGNERPGVRVYASAGEASVRVWSSEGDAELRCTNGHTSELYIRDLETHKGARLEVGPRGRSLVLDGLVDSRRAFMAVDGNNNPALGLGRAYDRFRARLDLVEGAPSLKFYDAQKVIWRTPDRHQEEGK